MDHFRGLLMHAKLGRVQNTRGYGWWGPSRQVKNHYFFFFCLEDTCVLTPLPVPTEILFSPQFHSHQETNMAARQTQ